MSSWLDVDDDIVDLADRIAEHLGSTRERVMKMAICLLAVDLGFKFELPRKEKEHAG